MSKAPKIMRKCSGRQTFDGVTLISNSIGIGRYCHISEDGQIMVQSNHTLSYYHGYALGHGPILSAKTGKAKRFRTLSAAARAAIALNKKGRP